ncbi:helix-turn-helix domain-containing protein [Actinokineospora auranticolor]|uniref:AcrR family transcriptional regulator n=1 Tax=Actinokineospora auranticolor TaxID=155976 RepID=A0A2S6GBK1_9PSEU|nr:TetR/AcrR family transcriptional regulator [Actinokineospora auranticolor]PPK61466.1 AcrR family transcriptional regulator [Actinokineospora auranticolor]
MTAERADARRNREVVLRTAVRLFAEDGPEVSLGRIARRAGVGAGTVYRHFPSKEILVEAVLAEHITGLATAADGWATRAAPGAALFGFLVEVVQKSVDRRHLCDALTADRGRPHAAVAQASRRFHEALERLLDNAKRAGTIRVDLRTDDLSAVIAGAAALRDAHRDPVRGARLVRLLLDGLRAVTEPVEFRDEPGGPRHGTCVECGVRLPVRATGRPPRYCGPTCRQRAHRRRAAE